MPASSSRLPRVARAFRPSTTVEAGTLRARGATPRGRLDAVVSRWDPARMSQRRISDGAPGSGRPVWICPACGARLVSRNLSHSCGRWSLETLFASATPSALALARTYVAMLHSLGDVQVIAQKTRLVAVARVRFAG